MEGAGSVSDLQLADSYPVTVEILRETKAAYLLRYEGDEQWIPKSQIYSINQEADPEFWIASWLLRKLDWLD